MNTTIILIYWILAITDPLGGRLSNIPLASGQAVFSDMAACQSALQKMRDDWATEVQSGPYGLAGGVCAPAATAPTVSPCLPGTEGGTCTNASPSPP